MTADRDAATVLADLRGRRDLDATLAWYDTLPPVSVAELLGRWRGSGLPTGHPLDGLLERLGWYGKRFVDAEHVDPLVFAAGDGRLFRVAPSRLPVRLALRHPGLGQLPFADVAFRLLRPLLTTHRPAARLRMTQYRGVLSATMCYDALPVHDVFRRVDDVTVVGAMDQRDGDHPLLFVLTRTDDPRTIRASPVNPGPVHDHDRAAVDFRAGDDL